MSSDRFDQPTMLETMGVYQPNAEDNRGSSMVQKHYEKLQQEKENAAMGKLQSLAPQLGSLVRALALQETNWNVEKAVLLLRRFQLANSDTLTQLHKKRKQLLASSTKRAGTTKVSKAKGGDSEQLKGNLLKDNSSDQYSDGRDSDSSDTRQHRSSKHQEKSENRKRKKGSRAEKKSKKKKRAKKESIDDDNRPAMYQYGKYGIIKESDMYSKRSEFTCWAAEVKKIDSESLPRHEEKELFRDYMEDYNTGTLPHRKYYDLEMYEARKRRKNAGGSSHPSKERVAFNDEEELRRQKEHDRLKMQQDRMKEAWEELKYTGKAEEMREQELLRMQLALAYKTGDTDQVQKLTDRLKPDEQ